MFEAARKSKGGVGHIKDLDMSVVKRRDTLKQEPGTCNITLINLETGESKSIQKTVRKESLRFDFNSAQNFNTDSDSQKVGKDAWDWFLNPLGFDFFTKTVKDKQIMILQNRQGFTLQQDDPEDDLVSLDIFKTVLNQSAQIYKQTGDKEQSLQYGRDIDVLKTVNGVTYLMNPQA